MDQLSGLLRWTLKYNFSFRDTFIGTIYIYKRPHDANWSFVRLSARRIATDDCLYAHRDRIKYDGTSNHRRQRCVHGSLCSYLRTFPHIYPRMFHSVTTTHSSHRHRYTCTSTTQCHMVKVMTAEARSEQVASLLSPVCAAPFTVVKSFA